MKSCQLKVRETLHGYHQRKFIEREGLTNGDGIAYIHDGAGKRFLTKAFAGSINQQDSHSTKTPEHRKGVEYNETQEGSLGTNTKDIEAKLRTTKIKLGYIEPETHRHGGKRTGAGRKKLTNKRIRLPPVDIILLGSNNKEKP